MDLAEDVSNVNTPSKGLPPKPEEPLTSDCCGSGCTPCIFDIYEEDLRKWELECKSVNHSLTKRTKDAGSVLSRSEYRAFRIDAITKMTADCCLYRFSIPDGGTLGLKTGQHIILR